MFIASKYEDVTALSLRAIITKVGHNKFSESQIKQKEVDILMMLQFKIGVPTVKEYMDSLIEISDLPRKERFNSLCLQLAKIASVNYSLLQISNELLAASIVCIAA